MSKFLLLLVITVAIWQMQWVEVVAASPAAAALPLVQVTLATNIPSQAGQLESTTGLTQSTTLTVTYVTSALTRGSVLSLIDAGGLGVGIGEWRVEKDGDFGTFRIDPNREVEVVQ